MQLTQPLNFFGKDNIQWWIGQVTDPQKGKWESARHTASLSADNDIYGWRCRVRIIGYHDCADDIPDHDLPLAHVVMPTNVSSTGQNGATFNYKGGEMVIGFFLDGEDAQQPIVIGTLFKQPYLVDANINQEYYQKKHICFKPWTPPDVKQNLQLHNIDSKTIPNSPESRCTYKGCCDEGLPNSCVAAEAAINTADVESQSATPCEDNSLAKVTGAIEDFIARINGFQKVLDVYVDPLLNKIANIDEEIKYTAGLIFDTMTGLMRRARTFLVQKIQEQFHTFLANLIPTPFRKVTGQALKSILDVIVCNFEKILRQLFKYISDSLLNMVGRVLDVPQCAIENFMADMLGQIFNVIDSTLGPLLNQVNGVLKGAIGKASSLISKALGFANLLLSILNCDELACPPVRKWSNATGPTDKEVDNFNKILEKASLVSAVSPKLQSINDMIDAEPTAPDCSTNSFKCGPPKISFVGGGGIAASGSAVVNAVGQLIGVSIANAGFGFQSPPLLTITDSCKNGVGANGYAVLGSVSPSDSVGPDGETIYVPDVNGSEIGVIDVVIDNPGLGYLSNTTETTLVPSVDGDEGGLVVTEVLPEPNSTGDGETSYIVEIGDVVVEDTGTGYSDGDTATVLSCDGFTPDTSGAEVQLKIAGGYIIGAKLINGGSGFTCIPRIRINSDTGVGATLTPSLKFIKVQDAKQRAAISQDAVVTVIDCVQK